MRKWLPLTPVPFCQRARGLHGPVTGASDPQLRCRRAIHALRSASIEARTTSPTTHLDALDSAARDVLRPVKELIEEAVFPLLSCIRGAHRPKPTGRSCRGPGNWDVVHHLLPEQSVPFLGPVARGNQQQVVSLHQHTASARWPSTDKPVAKVPGLQVAGMSPGSHCTCGRRPSLTLARPHTWLPSHLAALMDAADQSTSPAGMSGSPPHHLQ